MHRSNPARLMPMDGRYSKPADGLALEVEFNEHRGLVTHHPPVVPWHYFHKLGSDKPQGATVCILNVDFSARQKADVGVHAKLGAHNLFHVRGPAKARRINHTLHPTGACSNYIELETADIAVFAFVERVQQWVSAFHEITIQLSSLGSARILSTFRRSGPSPP